jgi:hypothetical protein
MRVPVGRASPHDLTHRPRASGPHDFSVRAHPRWVLHGWRALTAETMRRRCRRRVVSRLPLLTVSRPAAPSRADAVAATASRPASRDDRETPLVAGGMRRGVRQNRTSVNTNILVRGTRPSDGVFCLTATTSDCGFRWMNFPKPIHSPSRGLCTEVRFQATSRLGSGASAKSAKGPIADVRRSRSSQASA